MCRSACVYVRLCIKTFEKIMKIRLKCHKIIIGSRHKKKKKMPSCIWQRKDVCVFEYKIMHVHSVYLTVFVSVKHFIASNMRHYIKSWASSKLMRLMVRMQNIFLISLTCYFFCYWSCFYYWCYAEKKRLLTFP